MWGLPICACSFQCPQVILMFNLGCTHFMICWVRQTPLMMGSPGCMTPRRLMMEPSVSTRASSTGRPVFHKVYSPLLQITCAYFKILPGSPLLFSMGAVLPRASPPATHMAELCGPNDKASWYQQPEPSAESSLALGLGSRRVTRHMGLEQYSRPDYLYVASRPPITCCAFFLRWEVKDEIMWRDVSGLTGFLEV